MTHTEIQDKDITAHLQVLRDEALLHLSGDARSYDSAAALAAFEALELSDAAAATPLALEAFAAAVIARGKRPRRAQKSLYRLYQARLVSGEHRAYRDFVGQITASTNGGFSLEGITFNTQLTEVDQPKLWRDTKAAIATVEKVFGPAFLNSGTLLGAVREGRFIGHDDDVDIAVLLSAADSQEAARIWRDGIDLLIKRGVIEPRKRRNLGVFKLKSSVDINIDVFPAWIEAGRLHLYPHTSGELSQDDLLPLARCKMTKLPIPRNAEAMLEVNYGADWRVPDATFTFPWAVANKKFKKFRAALEKAEPT